MGFPWGQPRIFPSKQLHDTNQLILNIPNHVPVACLVRNPWIAVATRTHAASACRCGIAGASPTNAFDEIAKSGDRVLDEGTVRAVPRGQNSRVRRDDESDIMIMMRLRPGRPEACTSS